MTITLDFETRAIVDGSPISPVPVGFSIKYGDDASAYYAWGHSSDNNCTYTEAKHILTEATQYEDPIVFHNAKFDLGVLKDHFGLWPNGQIHDTLFLAFLLNPHEESLSLKPLSAKYLDMPADEQTELKEWIIGNIKKATEKNFGAYIADAPAKLVGKYAVGDTDRTYLLFKHMFSKVANDKTDHHHTMLDAYQNEIKLIPIIMEMEKTGVCLHPQIADITAHWENELAKCDMYILDIIGADCTIGGKLMFNRLKDKGYIDESKIKFTEKGNAKYGRAEVEELITNEELKTTLVRRSKLVKVLGTYLQPWTESSKKYSGRLHPYFNQTKSDSGSGTRTGRFSSNLQQIPKVKQEGLPYLRDFILPDPGHVLLVSDFQAQEIRVAAHYAEGNILKAYQNEPDVDVHTFIQTMIKERTGLDIPRRISKTVTFLRMYGGGPQKLVDQIGCSLQEAKAFFEAFKSALPEFDKLTKDLEAMCRGGNKIRTWGGRLYDVEPPEAVNGKIWEKYYKLANVLIQGSSADMTKHGMIRYHNHPERKGRLVLQVHDELVVSVPEQHLKHDHKILKWAMTEQPNWDVPVRSSSEWGYNYGQLEELKDVDA